MIDFCLTIGSFIVLFGIITIIVLGFYAFISGK